MKLLVDDWGKTLKTAWSVHALALCLLGAILVILEHVLPEWTPEWMQPWQIACGVAVSSVAGVIGRIVVQQAATAWVAALLKQFMSGESGAIPVPSRRATKGGAAIAVVLALATGSIAHWEGTELESYWDKYGKVWTACTGETRGIGPGMTFTAAECKAMLDARVIEFHGELAACIPGFTSAPTTVQAATVSWAYNVGSGAACQSTLAKRIAAERYQDACNELPRWNRSGGVVLKGLINRRVSERKLCLSGL